MFDINQFMAAAQTAPRVKTPEEEMQDALELALPGVMVLLRKGYTRGKIAKIMQDTSFKGVSRNAMIPVFEKAEATYKDEKEGKLPAGPMSVEIDAGAAQGASVDQGDNQAEASTAGAADTNAADTNAADTSAADTSTADAAGAEPEVEPETGELPDDIAGNFDADSINGLMNELDNDPANKAA